MAALGMLGNQKYILYAVARFLYLIFIANGLFAKILVVKFGIRQIHEILLHYKTAFGKMMPIFWTASRKFKMKDKAPKLSFLAVGV